MKKFILIIMTISSLSGCAQINEVQFQSYAIGMGIEYLENKYHVTLQFIDFSNISKNVQGGSQQSGPLWLATGKGSSIEEAIAKINDGIQYPINFDQLNIILFGKSLIEKKLNEALHALDTNYDIRVTGWVYGTEKKIEDVFTAKVPYNYPFTTSRINEPKYMQQRDSTIPSITLQDLIYQYNEKTKTILLPNITVTKAIIKKNKNSMQVNAIDGAFIIKDKHFKKLLTNHNLQGFIRVNQQAVRSLVTLEDNFLGNKGETAVELLKPQLRRRILNGGSKYGLDIKFTAIVRETGHHFHTKKIKQSIESKIRNEVYDSYQNSAQAGGDIFQLEDYMYRYMHSEWEKTYHNQQAPILNKKDIHVVVSPLKSNGQIRTYQ